MQRTCAFAKFIKTVVVGGTCSAHKCPATVNNTHIPPKGRSSMKMYVISDNIDTRTGMRLAGIDGCVAHGRTEVIEALESAIKDSDLGILLLTQKAMGDASDYINRYKLEHSLPLIVGIPDRHGVDKNQNRITEYIRDAIGLKI